MKIKLIKSDRMLLEDSLVGMWKSGNNSLLILSPHYDTQIKQRYYQNKTKQKTQRNIPTDNIPHEHRLISL